MNNFGLGASNGSYFDTPPREDDSTTPAEETPSSVSRSGRVRKKNSFLAEYESLDAIDRNGRKKVEKTAKSKERRASIPKVTLRLGPVEETPKRAPVPVPAKKIVTGRNIPFDPPLLHQEDPFVSSFGDLDRDFMDMGMDYGGGLSMVGAEEVIDDGSMDLDEDDTFDTSAMSENAHRLKSQTESTYFHEKSKEKKKHGKSPGGGSEKVKQTRKDKGSTRVTAYMLWAKDQRVHFQQQNPGIDLSTMSKKLSDLWSRVNPNEKKIWKSKAAKEMKKILFASEKMKHSGPRPVAPGEPKKRGRKPKALLLQMQQQAASAAAGSPSQASAASFRNSLVPEVNGHSGSITNQRFSPTKTPTAMTNGRAKPPTSSPGRGRHTHKVSSPVSGPPYLPNRSVTSTNAVTQPQRRFLSTPTTSRNGYGNAFGAKTSVSPRKGSSLQKEEAPVYKVNTVSPLDVAAHFSLLGESLGRIGERLKSHQNGQANDSLTVLLDSMLCALAPLACLTKQVPQMDCIPEENLTKILDDIAYIMPGL